LLAAIKGAIHEISRKDTQDNFMLVRVISWIVLSVKTLLKKQEGA